MNTFLRIFACVMMGFAANSCSKPDSETADVQDAALERSTLLVEELKKKDIDGVDYPISAAAYDGVPVVLVDVADPAGDYRATAQKIMDAIGAVEEKVWLVYETDMEMTDAERKAGMKDPKTILTRFNVGTGEENPLD